MNNCLDNHLSVSLYLKLSWLYWCFFVYIIFIIIQLYIDFYFFCHYILFLSCLICLSERCLAFIQWSYLFFLLYLGFLKNLLLSKLVLTSQLLCLCLQTTALLFKVITFSNFLFYSSSNILLLFILQTLRIFIVIVKTLLLSIDYKFWSEFAFLWDISIKLEKFGVGRSVSSSFNGSFFWKHGNIFGLILTIVSL